MRRYLNTLFITSQKTYLKKKGDTVAVVKDGRILARIPLITLDSIICFGNVLVSPFLLGACPTHGISVSFLTEHGRFLARSEGPVAGNVLLRKEQYRRSDDEISSADIAKFFICGKIANQRTVLQRALRDHSDKIEESAIRAALSQMADVLSRLEHERSLDVIRGMEGDAAQSYFSVFDELIVAQKDCFRFNGRNRRPPIDTVNALLSYLYVLLYHDCRSALECTGLDPAVGFLHRDRPGRLSLALDLMEEFRPFFVDRLALSLINRKEIIPNQFETSGSGAVLMSEDARKTVISAYQKKKEVVITHPYLEKKMHIGVLLHVQAQLLARYIRGDMDGYPVYIWK